MYLALLLSTAAFLSACKVPASTDAPSTDSTEIPEIPETPTLPPPGSLVLGPLSNLKKVTETGEIANIVDTTQPSQAQADFTGAVAILLPALGSSLSAGSSFVGRVEKFYIAGNTIFVLFNSKVNLGGSASCILASVDRQGHVTCIDSELDTVTWRRTANEFHSPPVQSSATGALYYSGYQGGKTVLRKYAKGTVTNLLNDNINLQEFVVVPDGSVVITGATQSTNSNWIRLINADNSLQNLRTTGYAHYLSLLPDNDVYMGFNYDSIGVLHYDSDQKKIVDNKWIGCVNQETNCDHQAASVGAHAVTLNQLFQNSISGKVFVITENNMLTGPDGAKKKLFEYYPSPKRILTPPLDSLTLGTQTGESDKFVLAGLDSQGVNRLISYNVATTNSVEILPNQDIEIYHLTYQATRNVIEFDGLRFSDNTYVIGLINMSTLETTFIPISGKLDDMQSF